MTINKQQITIIRTIISANGLEAHKESIIAGASNGRTTSTSQLTAAEATGLITALQKQYPYQPPPDPCHKMRGRILSICHTLQWYERNEKKQLVIKNGNPKLDYSRINTFCEKSLKKRLDKLNAAELQKMIYIFEQVEKDYLKKI